MRFCLSGEGFGVERITLMYFILIPIITLTAWVYASVGLGGGTAYLSIMSFWISDPAFLRPTAWSLNIVVSAVGFLNYYRQGYFDARLAWPFLAGGVLGAAVGGAIQIDNKAFQAMLAITLICASLRMLSAKTKSETRSIKRPPILSSLLLGTTIGIVSGLVGIGGGIVLGPVLIALGWVDTKRLAPITSFYVLLNSSAALLSFLFTGGSIEQPLTGAFCVAVLAGGFAGSQWGAKKASKSTLEKIFGIVALTAGVKLSCTFLGLI